MKKIALFFAGLSCVVGCNSVQKDQQSFSVQDISVEEYSSFGEQVSSSQIYIESAMTKKYQSMKEGDTIQVAFSGVVDDVCKAKGCWMKVNLENGVETMVKFKNYGFFVPMDIEKDTVILQGKAYVSETAVDELRHLASDAGKSDEEIAAITAPKKTYSFMADAVLIKE